MDKQRVLPPFEAAIRELGVTAESNTQCHDHVRGQTDADDGLGPRAIPFPRPEVAVNSNEADQRFKKRTGARIQRRIRMKQCKPGTACAQCRRRKNKLTEVNSALGSSHVDSVCQEEKYVLRSPKQVDGNRKLPGSLLPKQPGKELACSVRKYGSNSR
ncbi:hypothetical protein CNMCM6805_003967 [Aspergillus fumigatiaffinis]|uniref:Uncharacterized protein n=1 Tax=Aspergillus fumigatiaffinis TaxID=340414 RepID=A0A8H4GRP2_9EURO|nr:hypothetical protein CNMCM6805_003967 [Aspergillus fumigatiaffinis]